MKDNKNLIKFNRDNANIPQPIETQSYRSDYIYFGKDNLYPNFLIDLYYRSPLHSAIVNKKIEMAIGKDIFFEFETQEEETKFWLKTKNLFRSSNKNIYTFIENILKDLILFDSFSVDIVNNLEGKPDKIDHLDQSKIRYGEKNVNELQKIWYSNNWADTRKLKNRPLEFDNYLINPDTTRGIYSYTTYFPGKEYYSLPHYVSAVNWILLDYEISNFHINNVKNGFAPSMFIKFNTEPATMEEKDAIAASLYDQYKGTSNAGEVVISFAVDREHNIDIEPISQNASDTRFLLLNEQVIQEILSVHSVTNPQLFGIKTPGELGSSKDLIRDYNLYYTTVIEPYQIKVKEFLYWIYDRMGIQIKDIVFEPLKVIDYVFDEQILASVMTKEEIREKLQLPKLKVSEDVLTDENKNLNI